MNENPEEKPVIPAIEWVKARMAWFQSLTQKEANDNVWILGLKLILQGIGILLFLLMSPFALFAIILSIMVTM